MSELYDELKRETTLRFSKYEQIKEKGIELQAGEFWDVVVLTAVDEAQASGYNENLKNRLEKGDLSSYPDYVVVSDPPGAKIGNGGSTLVVIDTLHEKYGDLLWNKRVIVIHAGGYSQRMPNASIIGKAFISLPLAGNIYTAMDIKLATYIDFPKKIKNGGMFVCCPDTIEVYTHSDMKWAFPEHGFTGLAHLSPLNIAKDHGVYILNGSVDDEQMIMRCQQFLHKPSIDEMKSTRNCIHFDPSKNEEKAFTDSAFFMSSSAMKALLEFYQTHSPLDCEIDAYGDFLQAVGPNCNSNYVHNTKNVVSTNNSLVETRTELFNAISELPLFAVVLDNPHNNATSRFYHLGTTHEYLHHLASDMEFQKIFEIQPLCKCTGSCNEETLFSSEICIFNSDINTRSVGKGSVISHCVIHPNTFIGRHCILDSCEIFPNCYVPDDTIMSTTVFYPNFKVIKYTTVLFNNNDDRKKKVHRDRVGDLQYLGKPVTSIFNVEDILPNGEEPVSLWNLRLFPVSETRKIADSTAQAALQQLSNSNTLNKLYKDQQLCSMSYILKYKRM